MAVDWSRISKLFSPAPKQERAIKMPLAVYTKRLPSGNVIPVYTAWQVRHAIIEDRKRCTSQRA